MSKIRIKNFGPIKDGYQENDGWLDVNKVTVFVGNQGSGKSTIAKLISTFIWIEKALIRGDYDKEWFESKSTNRFKSQFLPYHRLGFADTKKPDIYLKPNSIVEYQGDAYHIKYEKGTMVITEISNVAYSLPQIMYVPAERNFLTYIKDAGELRLSGALRDFNTEYEKAKNSLKDFSLPINNINIEYNKQYDNLYLRGKDYKLEIAEAASGFQSFVPLYLVSSFLAKSVKTSESKETMSSKEKLRFEKGVQDIWNNKNLTDEQRTVALSALSSKFNKSSFVNIVEEPEQNLFPSSQWKMLQSLLEFNNMNLGNKLILTTHSPYLISYLTLSVKAESLNSRIQSDNLRTELGEIISLNSTLNSDNLSIYELNEEDGTIASLETYNGLPSDENKLNEKLDEGNELFAKLLDIQKRL
ncbi:AAA family ATPase [Bacteroides sp. UBA939]|uniref:AAA family ATPase n=1 Tax=Bacteroides sp. UBA939 TaxID=1946092 RepID=UPI0025BB01C7|nr:AAA family ATPase [Bacteroides sp. UBA939]